jgi:RimJ/RimL family protein N-acetyltransferase
MFLEGDRVRLRPFELADAATFQAWINDVDVARLVGRVPFQASIPAEEQFIRGGIVNDWEHGIHLAIEAIDGEEPVLIGTIDLRDLHPVARHGEIGILVGERAYWNRGFGSDAVRTICRYGFEDMDLHRISLTVAAYNPRAQRAYEKVGFVIEGRLRDHRYAAGRYHDTLVMGLLRTDFEAREAERLVSKDAPGAASRPA